MLGIWDTVRLVRLRLKRDIEPVSVFHLVAEGTFTVAIIVAVACIVDQVRRFWAGEFLIRGWVFSAGMLVQEYVPKDPISGSDYKLATYIVVAFASSPAPSLLPREQYSRHYGPAAPLPLPCPTLPFLSRSENRLTYSPERKTKH